MSSRLATAVTIVTPTASVPSSPPDGADGDDQDEDEDEDEAAKGEADTETKAEP